SGTKTITVGAAGSSFTYAGQLINGAGVLRVAKSGTGAWTLTGTSSSYTGNTSITAGVLKVGIDNALPDTSSIVSVSGNSTFDLNGFSQTITTLNISGTGTAKAL